ncbi:RNA polymerase sigma factor [Winogradskya consettensis]|uniref:DNA-directed RNA polymerase sigma-70 factor n=1 Tax=Winogradskya consettensis TaxID=113560 RepID=A0A919VMY5_9ACTN|nr:RNA polymerase sigma factor [Actinoplanes consettensis]GIM72174.1 DNA-directed RNA polymerase sigma-70 factor [Actinoplanes consettensis]
MADDAELIGRSRSRPEAFTGIFDRHAPHIHRYLARRLGDQSADDLVGEVFLVAFRRRDGYDRTRPDARPWLYGIATNLVAQHRRDEARDFRLRTSIAPSADVINHADQVATDLSASALRDTLQSALAELNSGDRDVLLLVAQEELTYEQVAAALEIPVGTVRSRLHRARIAVRAALGGSNPLTVFEEGVRHG